MCVVPANGAVTQGAMTREYAIKEDQSVFIHYISVLVPNKVKLVLVLVLCEIVNFLFLS